MELPAMDCGIRIESLLSLAAWNHETERTSSSAPQRHPQVAPLNDILNAAEDRDARPQQQQFSLHLIAPQSLDERRDIWQDGQLEMALRNRIALSALWLADGEAHIIREIEEGMRERKGPIVRLPGLDGITKAPAATKTVPLKGVLNDEDSRSPHFGAVQPATMRTVSTCPGVGRKRRKLSCAAGEHADIVSRTIASVPATSKPAASLTLPKPPPRIIIDGHSDWIPPVISGLHDPPEDARLMPRISTPDGSLGIELPNTRHVDSGRDEWIATIVEDRCGHPAAYTLVAKEGPGRDASESKVGEQVPAAQAAPNNAVVQDDQHQSEQVSGTAEEATSLKLKPTSTYRAWSKEEHEHLMDGTERFGVGNWKKILTCPDYIFKQGRTAVDLKERFRRQHRQAYKKIGVDATLKRKAKTRNPNTVDTGHSGEADEHVQVEGEVPLRHATLTAKAAPGPNTSLRNIAPSSHESPRESFKRSERRGRVRFSDQEDDAILRGFEKYGTQWTRIQADPDLHLGHRSRTDIRDRMRNKFPGRLKADGTTEPLIERETNEESKTTSPPIKAWNEPTRQEQPGSTARLHITPPPVKANVIVPMTPPASLSSISTSGNPPTFSFPTFLELDALKKLNVEGEVVEPITLSRNIFDWVDQKMVSHAATGTSGITHLQPLSKSKVQASGSSEQHPWHMVVEKTTLYDPVSDSARAISHMSQGLPSMSMQAMSIAGMLAEENHDYSDPAPVLARIGNAGFSLPSVVDLMMGLEGDNRELLW